MITMTFTFLFHFNSGRFTIFAVYLFPVSGVSGSKELVEEVASEESWGNRIVSFYCGRIYTAFSRQNMLALLILHL